MKNVYVNQVDHIKQEENFSLVKDAKVIYIAGFFITVSPETIKLVSETAANGNKIFCMVTNYVQICNCEFNKLAD